MSTIAEHMVETATETEDEADALLLWVLAWSELAVFGILLGAVLVMGMLQPQVFAAARAHLNPALAAVNTLVLMTSGWQAALAARRGAPLAQRRRALVLAALLGLLFVAIKLYEYSGEIEAASGSAYVFFDLYFLITGFHLLHVLFGAGVLLAVAVRPVRSNVVLITTLWHVVDLIWVVMFPIIYLV